MKPRALIAWLDKVLEGPPRLTGSYWEEKLGLGVEVNGAVAARHPFEPEIQSVPGAVLADGTIVDW